MHRRRPLFAQDARTGMSTRDLSHADEAELRGQVRSQAGAWEREWGQTGK